VRKLGVVLLVVVLAASAAGSARAARTSVDSRGTILVNGAPTFPLALLKAPPLGATTPWGADALDEVTGAGVNLLAAGPFGAAWSEGELAAARELNAAAAARGAFTWVNLRELARAQPGTPEEERLRALVETLRGDAALALWKGADEPWLGRVPVTDLQHAHAVVRALDPAHLSLVIQAPRGTISDLAPYSAVADVHSVDVYPMRYTAADPQLHAVGRWTRRLRSATPNRAVLTTLQICFSGSDDPAGSGAYVLPTGAQERYMAYDAIMNGARGLIFFGGTYRECLGPADAPYAWNWTFWTDALRPLVRELGPRSRIYPALVTWSAGPRVRSSDWTTPVVARRAGREIWLIAARHGRGSARVTIGGLPRGVSRGWVYREGRRIGVRNGSFTDAFARWDVHVYRFLAPH